MPDGKHGVTVLDTFCGAGGFSEGFLQAGFDIALGIDFWAPACSTHEINRLGETRKQDLLKFRINQIFALKEEMKKKHGEIDVLIGSPPCTEFSWAKNGGKGDIERGMLLVRRHLRFVAVFRPKYWLMENVPRLKTVLDEECEISRGNGWTISFEKLGINREWRRRIGLDNDVLRIPCAKILTASDFGACQSRRRFIAGRFPEDILETFKVKKQGATLGNIIRRLENGIVKKEGNGWVRDPNYSDHKVRRNAIRDYGYCAAVHPMHLEEMRHLKRRHIQYGQMALPDRPERPARTIMATYNSSSRESILLRTDEPDMEYQGRRREVFRQPYVREVACLQGFPLDFQLDDKRLINRYKLVGNAVPCQLSFAIAKSILSDCDRRSNGFGKEFSDRTHISVSRHKANEERPLISEPERIVDEAENPPRTLLPFKARDDKPIRRRFLASKLEGSSCMVVFENHKLIDASIKGGKEFKICIQKGIGSQYHRIYLDRTSVRLLIRSLDNQRDSVQRYRSLISALINAVGDDRFPFLRPRWEEFPGYDSKDFTKYASYVDAGTRKRIPTVSKLQYWFTHPQENIGDFVGAIDFFDCLDATMLSIFKRKGFSDLRWSNITVDDLWDDDCYPNRKDDERITASMTDVEIPLVTLSASLFAMHVLSAMYRNDRTVSRNAYATSLKNADSTLMSWLRG